MNTNIFFSISLFPLFFLVIIVLKLLLLLVEIKNTQLKIIIIKTKIY